MTLDQDLAITEHTDVVHQLDVAKLTIEVLKNDIRIIAEALKSEAGDRGWCEDYRAFVDDVNARCSDAHLQPCWARWRIEYKVVIEATTDAIENATEQLRGDLQVSELEPGDIHRVDVTLNSRERVEG
jgi:hypothetical protein